MYLVMESELRIMRMDDLVVLIVNTGGGGILFWFVGIVLDAMSDDVVTISEWKNIIVWTVFMVVLVVVYAITNWKRKVQIDNIVKRTKNGN